ncbi:hypothetical protein B7P43_G01647 [Cryptotermes secundus]|uniref:C2H2-type domain-containing protein n=1 Tax=Cryptotermes secundus TaxID=105785 RepID=A0A2J7PR32_9NEOP|nr:hypothetical protein B7P43_G01647 [Cryptotermes secundus]
MERPSKADIFQTKDVSQLAGQEPIDDLSAHEVFAYGVVSQTEQSRNYSDFVDKKSGLDYECDKNDSSHNSYMNDKFMSEELASVETQNTGVQLYHCQHCGREFGCTSSLKQHLKTVHKKLTEHKCRVCNEVFTSRNKLQSHRISHDPSVWSDLETSHLCHACGKTFNTSSKLRCHEKRVHQRIPVVLGEKKHICEVCGLSFQFNKYLRKHTLKHGEKNFVCERPFSCEHCGHAFRIYSSLLFHRRVVHEGRKVYGNKGVFPCEVCGKVFSTKQYRDIHLRIHKGEKPYVCTICNRAFTQRTSLVNHSALHSDHRPYPCHLCEKAFRRRETLIIHIRTHTGEKPHICEICGRGFAQLTDMKKHRLKIHNVVIPKKD